YQIYGFDTTTNLPFPKFDTREANLPPVGTRDFVNLPYIAFNYLGQLTTAEKQPEPAARDVIIPLAHGSVITARNVTNKMATMNSPDVLEDPPGNSTNAYNLIWID